ncbi:MAG: hypothetical protein ACHRHE_03940 [Tepidisphaerales bacterium]
MARNRKIDQALDRLAAAEDKFLASRFLAPVVCGRKVQVCIAGIRCQLRVTPEDFQGWGLFRPQSHLAAILDRPAQLAERRRYLDLFPALSTVLCRQDGADRLALPAQSDRRFKIEGMICVHLAAEVDLFDTVRIRFDGSSFWFDQVDPRADPGGGLYLRQNLSRMVDPRNLSRPGLTAQQVAAYAVVHAERIRQTMADKHQQDEHRLAGALRHAGAQLSDFAERGDVYRVSYEVDGSRHTSVVRKNDLTVQSAGICLSGEDENFDLHSLVGVLREGRQEGMLRRMNPED